MESDLFIRITYIAPLIILRIFLPLQITELNRYLDALNKVIYLGT